MKKALLMLMLVVVLLLALGIGGRRVLQGSGWDYPAAANGIYIQRARGLYELKHGQDVFRLQYVLGRGSWYWMYNDQPMAAKKGPSVIGTYSLFISDQWSGTEPTVSEHRE